MAKARGPGGRLCATSVLETPEVRRSFVFNESRSRGPQHSGQGRATRSTLLQQSPGLSMGHGAGVLDP